MGMKILFLFQVSITSYKLQNKKIEASFSFNQIQVSRRFAQPRLTTLTSLSWGPTSNTKVRGYSEKLTPHVCE
jgi:hypothetical protein